MTQVPLNLGLRDLNIEFHNVTGKDDYVYNRTRHLMTALIDVVNGLDPSLHAYMDVFRNQEREVVFQNDQFLIQYDGLRRGDRMYDNHWRLIWRDLVVQWYKHPKRDLHASREISHAEEAMLVAEFKEAMKGFVEYKPRAVIDADAHREQAKRIGERLARNGVSGAMMPRSLGGPPYELRDYQKAVIEASLRGDSPHFTHQRFGRMSENPDANIPQGTLGDFMGAMGKLREEAKGFVTKFPEHLKRSGPLRMTQGKFGDYEAAAAASGPSVRAVWERIKAEGIEIVPYDQLSEGEKLGVGDLSVMFMYPHEVKVYNVDHATVRAELDNLKGLKGPVGQPDTTIIDPMGFLDLNGNPRSDVDWEKLEREAGIAKTTAPGTGAGLYFSSIRPRGKRISEESNRYNYEDARKVFEEAAKNVLPSRRPQMTTELSDEAAAVFLRKHDMMHRVMQGGQLSMLELVDFIGTSTRISNESPEVRAMMADIDPAPPIDEDTLLAYGLVKKNAGCAPLDFVRHFRVQPNTMAMLARVAVFLLQKNRKE